MVYIYLNFMFIAFAQMAVDFIGCCYAGSIYILKQPYF